MSTLRKTGTKFSKGKRNTDFVNFRIENRQ